MRNVHRTAAEHRFRAIPVGVLAVGAASLAWNQYGSILARDWLPYALATALLAGGLLWSGFALSPARASLLTLAALFGLAGWDALSLVWSPVPALARDEALLVVFYGLVFLVPLVVLRNERDRRAAATVVVFVLAALAVAAVAELLIVSRPTDNYENGRLTFPISYVNAQAALFVIGFWPCTALAAERDGNPILRAAAVSGACAMLAGGLMTQSKGGLIALAWAAIVFFLCSRNPLRAVMPAFIPVALVGGSYTLLTEPFRERLGPQFGDAVRSASVTALVLVGVAAVIGFVYAFVDRRVIVPQRVSRLTGAFLLAALGIALVGSVATFFAVVDRPGHYLDEKWNDFKTLPAHERGSSHLTSLGSNRYDFWRVELRLAREHPVAGVGARGFAQRYLKDRRSSETPARGHSLELDALAETGLVGLLLLIAAIGLPLLSALRRARRTALLAGLAAAGAYGVVHASVDWIWTSPAVGGLLFLLLGIANAGAATNGNAPRLIRGRLALAGGLGALALGVGGFALPWISARLTTDALRHPSSANADLRWARRLDPLSVEPWLARASLAARPADEVFALRRAVQQEPDVSGLRYRLGLAYLRLGKKAFAQRELSLAHRLDPRDAGVARALRGAGR